MKNILLLLIITSGLVACTCKDSEPVIGNISEVLPAVVITPAANQTASTDYTLTPDNRFSTEIAFDRAMDTTSAIVGTTLLFSIPELNQSLSGTVNWQTDSILTFVSDPIPAPCLPPTAHSLQIMIKSAEGSPSVMDTLGIELDGDLDGQPGGDFITQFLGIEDKEAPVCIPPNDVVLDCNDLPVGFDPNDDTHLALQFGDAQASDNCSANVMQVSKSVDWNCGSKMIIRNFEAEDAQGLVSQNPCSQTIIVNTATPPAKIELMSQTDFCSLNSTDCTAPFDFLFQLSGFCLVDNILVEAFVNGQPIAVSGAFPDFTLSGQESIGVHLLEIQVTDDCSNAASLMAPFQIFDCHVPAPICLNGLSIELNPGKPCTDADNDGDIDEGFATLNASDFITGMLPDCSGPITFSINRAGETPDPMQSSLVVTFDDPDTLALEIYAWDSANNPMSIQPGGLMGGPNYDYCEIFVLIQDNMLPLCGIPGWIDDRNGEPVEFVEVSLSGGTTDMYTTQADGFYEFCSVIGGLDYTVIPFRDDDPLNGVSSFDLALLADHITGTSPLADPYQLIAADANNSGTVTTLDYIQIQQLILGNITNFPNNTSWRFVDACYTFPNPS